ncbi:MAG TPA: outer membrane protein assembly factor BamD, partial [Verrucomicrobiae bacterium]|nr:outer membrane protein assembly factor BamD [Verrucomicrobiae bacterium]
MPKTPQDYFAEGEALEARGKHEEAIEQWKKVRDSFPAPELAARAELGIADAQFANGSYIEAAAGYESFRKLHPTHEKAPYALYRTGLSQLMQFDGIDRDQTAVRAAAMSFETYLRLYPKGAEAEEVRKKLEDATGKLAEHELYVARFYLRTGKYAAAAARVEELLRRQPRLSRPDEALFLLGSAYLMNGNAEGGRQIFQRLATEFPFSPFVAESQKALRVAPAPK